MAHLKEIVLRFPDLPTGSTAHPNKVDPNAAANQAAMVKCMGARDTAPGKLAEAHSELFALGNAVLSSSASSYRSQSDVDADNAMLRSPKASPCVDQMLRTLLAPSLPKDVAIESSAMKVTPGPAGGPANVVATGTGTINLKIKDDVIRGFWTIAFITGPFIEAQVMTFNTDTPLPASQVQSMVAAVATRAAKG